MLKEITIFTGWDCMIEGANNIQDINEQETKDTYEIMAEQWIRDRHPMVNKDTEISFEWLNNPRYSHECDNGLDDGIQHILEELWDSQGFWETNE